jgi:hypothetical protein
VKDRGRREVARMESAKKTHQIIQKNKSIMLYDLGCKKLIRKT